MGHDARIESLRSKHAELDSALKDEARRPVPDPAAVAALKRQKLRLKDELMRVAHA